MVGTVARPANKEESMADLFERYTEVDVTDQIREYPLAWVCSRQGPAMAASLLPLLAETGADGQIHTLLGHMARRNPLFQALTDNPSVLILFSGPQAYVSPACVSDPNWGPTWNYAQVRIEASIEFDEAGGDEALARLVADMEQSHPTGWTAANLGARYRPMERAIIAFRARVTHLQARFKLGQDEKPERLQEIVSRHPDSQLVRWMRRFNPGRC